MATLYRKYRPQSFGEVIGQDNIKQILLEEIRTEHLAHAYLFSGPRGTGKTTLARLLAKALNCAKRKKSGEPCSECESCLAIAQGISQDLVEMDAASNRRIDEIRELREHVKYVPVNSLYKIYIIDEAHMLTNEAFNALLKTLEEPPKHVIFILATTELYKIPETIFSRCQHFIFRKLSLEQIIGRLKNLSNLEGVKVAEEVLEEIARRANGASRDAESILGQVLSLGKKTITAEDALLFLPKVGFGRIFGWLSHLIFGRAGEALRDLQALENEGAHLEFFLSETIEFTRQIFLFKAIEDKDNLELYFSQDEIKEIQKLVADVSLSRLRIILVELLRASNDMKLSPDLPILPLELAVVALCEKREESKIGSPITTNINKIIPPVILERKDAKPSEVIESKDSINKSFPQDAGQNNKAQITANHTLDDILAGWGEVLACVHGKNNALNFMLSVARPVAVNGNTVELAFKYRLQQERVSEIKNQTIVEDAIAEVFGAKYRLLAKLQEDIKLEAMPKKPDSVLVSPPSAQESEISGEDLLAKVALDVFAGAVVEG